ncbi:protein ADM2 [Chelmon rostratus]|uniref:protein ADM2 n=1 Tax=Chelmon rostratus TaxID=109905 RepID=UPI001BEB26AF|nr:protein ADM2 [Chelmon rostratus]
MCALLPAWLCLLFGFLPLEIQSRALTLQSLTHRHRMSLARPSKYPKSSYLTTMPTAPVLPVAVDNHSTQGDRHIIWRARLHKEPPPRLADPLLDQSDSVLREAPAWQRGSRGRRHVNGGSGRGHGHLMRVGCVLGTCQVQNLSHRLYQLIGQSGREDSSPINPRSPHSYG